MKSSIAFILFVIAFVSCPICFLLTVNADAATLDCQRVEDREIQCTRTLWTLRIIPYERTAIKELSGARLTTDDCRDGCYYRVFLYSDTVATLAPVSASWSHDREAKQELVDQINAFVEDGSATSLFVIEGADTTSWGGVNPVRWSVDCGDAAGHLGATYLLAETRISEFGLWGRFGIQ